MNLMEVFLFLMHILMRYDVLFDNFNSIPYNPIMAAPATALIADKKRTTVTLPSHLLAHAEELASKRNTTVSAIVAQAMEAGMETLLRKERAQQTYEQLRTSLTGLTDDEQLLVDGIRLTPDEASTDK